MSALAVKKWTLLTYDAMLKTLKKKKYILNELVISRGAQYSEPQYLNLGNELSNQQFFSSFWDSRSLSRWILLPFFFSFFPFFFVAFSVSPFAFCMMSSSMPGY